MRMVWRAITLTQPWATLVEIGAKRMETRSWNTPYRGPLAIHAAKAFPGYAQDVATSLRVVESLKAAGYGSLPFGRVVAVCDLVDVVRTEDVALTLSDVELTLGDYDDGRWAWKLENVRRVPTYPACRGMLGLWMLPEEVRVSVHNVLDTEAVR